MREKEGLGRRKEDREGGRRWMKGGNREKE